MSSLIIYFLSNAFVSIMPFCLIAAVFHFVPAHSRPKWQIVLFCITDLVLTSLLYSVYSYELAPDMFDLYSIQYYMEQYALFTSIINVAAQIIHWGKVFVLYFILRKKYVFLEESDEFKVQQLSDNLQSAVQYANQTDEANWYTVGEQIKNRDITIKKLSDPAVLRIKDGNTIHNTPITKKKDYITVRHGQQVQFINCVPIDEENIQSVTTAQTIEEPGETDNKQISNKEEESLKMQSIELDNEQQIINKYLKKKKEKRIKILKKSIPYIIIALVFSVTIACIVSYYNTKLEESNARFEEYKKTISSEIREEIWHEAFNAGYDSVYKR